MEGLWLPRTIEDDEEVEVDDSDSEEELPSRGKGKKPAAKRQKGSSFREEFSFPAEAGGVGRAAEGGWAVEDEVLEWAEKKRDLVGTSLDSKISRVIERRKQKVCCCLVCMCVELFGAGGGET